MHCQIGRPKFLRDQTYEGTQGPGIVALNSGTILAIQDIEAYVDV